MIISENGDTKTGVVPRESSSISKSIEIFDAIDGFLRVGRVGRVDRVGRLGVGGIDVD